MCCIDRLNPPPVAGTKEMGLLIAQQAHSGTIRFATKLRYSDKRLAVFHRFRLLSYSTLSRVG